MLEKRISELPAKGSVIAATDLVPIAEDIGGGLFETKFVLGSELSDPNKADLVNGLVPSSQLPSYVDDVLEFADLAGFPITGETGKIYVSIATNITYRWSGSIYVEISEGAILTAATIGAVVDGATDYATPLNGDKIGIWDVANSLFKAVTWTNLKRVLRIADVLSVVSGGVVTATNSNDLVIITAQAQALTLANPAGSFTEGQKLIYRIKDNGTARAISYGAKFRAIGITLPTTTVINKTTYIGVIYNATDDKFDALATGTEA